MLSISVAVFVMILVGLPVGGLKKDEYMMSRNSPGMPELFTPSKSMLKSPRR